MYTRSTTSVLLLCSIAVFFFLVAIAKADEQKKLIISDPLAAATPATSTNEPISTSKNVTAVVTSHKETRPDVALVILNWKRFKALKKIVNMVCARKNVKFIKEIILWNNNPNTTITHEHFPSCYAQDASGRKKPTIQIINSPGNVRFVGRYYACLMAKSPVCLFQDDDTYVWQMRSLYAQFLRHPNVLHTITLSEVFHYESVYAFHNDTLGVHSGFAMVGFGGIVKKSIIENFLQTMVHLKLPSKKIELFADVYLPILINQHKYSLSSQVSVIEQKNSFGTDAVAVDNTKELFWMMKKLARNWAPTLKAIKFKVKKDRQASKFLNVPTTDFTPLKDRNARATCVSDECILITNLNPFNYVYDQGFHLYNAKKRYAIGSNITCRADTYYARAVDLNPENSWKSRTCHSWSWEKILKRGEELPYFGLDLLKDRLVTNVTLSISNETDCVQTGITLQVAYSSDINTTTGNVDKWHDFNGFTVETVNTTTHGKWVEKGAKPEHEAEDDEEEEEEEEGKEKQKEQVLVQYTVKHYVFKFAKPEKIRFIKLNMAKDDAVCSKGIEVYEVQANYNKKHFSMTKLLRKMMNGKQVDVYEE